MVRRRSFFWFGKASWQVLYIYIYIFLLGSVLKLIRDKENFRMLKIFQDAYKLRPACLYMKTAIMFWRLLTWMIISIIKGVWGRGRITFDGVKASHTTIWRVCTQSFSRRHPVAILDSNRESLSFSILQMSQLQPHGILWVLQTVHQKHISTCGQC